MADLQVRDFPLDRIEATGTLSHMLGLEGHFKHESKSGNVITALSNARVKARWVENLEGGTLSKGQALTWDTNVGESVQLADAGDKPCGVVSPMVETTVASTSYFWMVIEGPAKAITDGNSTLSLGDLVCTVGTGTGKVRKQVAAPADATAGLIQTNTVVGTVMESVAATDAVVFACWIHPGRGSM